MGNFGVLMFLLAVSSGALAEPATSQRDAGASLIKGTRELLLDNERVQMVRLVYPVGSESGMHTHAYTARTAYFVTGGKLEVRTENGESKTMNVAAGDAFYLPAATHNLVNLGSTEIVIIEQELK